MRFTVNNIPFGSMPRIEIMCPECKSSNIGQENHTYGAIWCNDCGHRSENKQNDLNILLKGGGEISPL